LDIVSICTWPILHKEMTVNAAVAGVKMIWCEKPMAVGIDEIDEMVRTCSDHKVRLFINHQRRYEMPYQITRQMIDAGVLGQVERLEGWVGRGWDLSSWGTHWVDMHRFLLHDAPADWVLAQAPRSGKIRYGHPVEDQMLLQIMFSNGVISFIHLGNHLKTTGLRVVGEKGTISFLDGGVDFKIQHEKNASELAKKFLEGKQYVSGMNRALEDIIISYEKNQVGEIDVHNGARSAEIVIAAYQSAIEGKVLRLPLENRSFNLLKNFQG
ncbi:MAG: Gfo/Idh/MocA family oxidoreductase, partial [Thaumarchaeota archaeon]|nr:Gfo/Idh/MocA family oxidoreductase [Nitrososphaerota archaeon]